MADKNLYKVIFYNQGKVFEVYARSVSQGNLYGFVEIEQLVYGERSTVVVDPSEERIKSEFAGVSRSYIPMHAIVRIDEVEKQGISKVSTPEGNVTPFPQSVFVPGDTGGKGSE